MLGLIHCNNSNNMNPNRFPSRLLSLLQVFAFDSSEIERFSDCASPPIVVEPKLECSDEWPSNQKFVMPIETAIGEHDNSDIVNDVVEVYDDLSLHEIVMLTCITCPEVSGSFF